MGLKVYKATGAVLTAAKSILGVRLRGSGLEHLSERPTLFVVNHFTRFETFLVPYVISSHNGRLVRSLATHTLFRGWFGKYLRALGVMSTHHPRRNRTIIGELMTGRHDWVIYPEGGLIKNKKMVEKGRLRLNHPTRQGPPHTGAALLALKAEICKRRYLAACEANDTRRIRYYQRRYGLTGPVDLSPHGT
ncbi:MAG: lysophospholipid acyltransferase family protein, partial [Planctomycetota bacterium]